MLKLVNGVRNKNVQPVGRRFHGEDVITISTGLSVKVVGHRISLQRDEAKHVAVVVVVPIDGHAVTGLEGPAIKVAADLLAERARRFLSREWTVVDWQPPKQQKRGAG